MDKSVLRVIQPIRIEPEKEQGGREGESYQNIIKERPLPIVGGYSFLNAPFSVKRAFPPFFLSNLIL